MEIKIKLKKLNKNAIIPAYATENSAGADLCYVNDFPLEIESGKTVLINTGIAIEIPQGYAAFVFARSGLSLKKGLAPANKVGVIDSDYRGEIKVSLHNHSLETQTVSPGERIAQLVILPYIKAIFFECDELNQTSRGEGGFGSTGK